MVLKELLPDTISPFRAEMAALREAERQRLIRLVQVFSTLTFGVYFTASIVLLIYVINNPGFFNFTFFLSTLLNLPVAAICYRLAARKEQRTAARLLLF